jgi:hypothetical protein
MYHFPQAFLDAEVPFGNVALTITPDFAPWFYGLIREEFVNIFPMANVTLCQAAPEDFQKFYELVLRLRLEGHEIWNLRGDDGSREYRFYHRLGQVRTFDQRYIHANTKWLRAAREFEDLKTRNVVVHAAESPADRKPIKFRRCDCGLCDRCLNL